MRNIGIIGILSILVLIVALSGCTSTNTYNANGVSFNYPTSWQQYSSPNTGALVAVGDPNSKDNSTGNPTSIVVIQSIPLPSGENMKQVYDANYAQFSSSLTNYKTISENTTTVDGTTAYVNVHSFDNNGVTTQEEAVWLSKNNNIYVILCSALQSNFASQQDNFNMIINSFKVQ